MNTTGFVDSVGRDLRFALRGLSRRPAFTFAAVLTLALGIGATAAIFSVVYSVLIKPLPYPNSHELVRIRQFNNRGNLSATVTMYLTYRDENRTFAAVGIWAGSSATLTDRGEPQRVRALVVSDGTLQALGVQPARGRWFTEAEHEPVAAGPTPVILSHAFWRRRLGGDEAVLGRELALEPPGDYGGVPFAASSRVVGIMPPDFKFLDMTPQPDVILAMRLDPAAPAAGGQSRFPVLARLQPGVTPAGARADVERMLEIWSRDAAAASFQISSAEVRPLKDDLVGGVASALWVILGAIGAVLLIACANIANLMLVRADARRHELAVRAALGAVPRRIAKELFAESLVIGAAGGVLGLMLAYLGLQALVAIDPSDLPRVEDIAVYPPVLVFTVAVSLAATLVFGSITALKVAFRGDARALGAPRGATASRERSATRSALVVAQVALALVLVVSAALMVRSFQALRHVDPGFSDPATIQTADIWMPTGPVIDMAQSAQWTRVQHEILDRIAALPGVASAGFVDDLPILSSGALNNNGFAVDGQALEPQEQRPQAHFKFISPGYFEAMGTRLIAGRGLTWSDIEARGRVVVVSENFARQLATEPATALGLRIRFATYDQDAWREVIGVVQSIHEEGLYREPPAMVYWPAYAQDLFQVPEVGTPSVTLAIRSERAGTASLMEEIGEAIRSVSPSIPVDAERTMRDVYAGSLARTSFTLVMLAIAGGMALALGVIGIYGVIAYVVSQRKREIGIRSALGAEARQIKKTFLLHGLTLSAVGAVVGLVAAMALEHLLSSLLFGIGPLDPVAFIAAVVVTIAAAAVASYVPSRRAANIDPGETLRAE